MSAPLVLDATPDDLSALWNAVHKLRSGSKSVTVERDALVRVLLDHSIVLTRLGGKVQDAPTTG